MKNEKYYELYPDNYEFDEKDGGELYNDDNFFYGIVPEDLNTAFEKGHITWDTAERTVQDKTVKFVTICLRCNEPDCCSLPYLCDDFNLEFAYHDCRKPWHLENIRKEHAQIFSGDEFYKPTEREIKEKVLRIYDSRVIQFVKNHKLVSLEYIKHKLANAKPSSNFSNPFKGFNPIDAETESFDWIIDGLIPEKSIVALFGLKDSYKSFTAIDLALSVATGTDFCGKKVKRQGTVLYLAPEASTGIPKRRDAWLKQNDWFGCFVPFFTRGGSFSFSSQEDRDYLANELNKQKEWKPVLVVFDTLGQSLGDYDENSASDINRIARYLNDLKVHEDCSFLIVDHSGHEARRARGSSAKGGAWDAEFFASKNKNIVTIKNIKMKDAELHNDIHLEAVKAHDSLVLKQTKPEPKHADVLLEIIQQSENSFDDIIREQFYEKCSADTLSAKQKAFSRSIEKLIREEKIIKDQTGDRVKLVLKT